MASSGGTTGTAVSGGTPLSGSTSTYERTNILPLESWRRVVGYHPWHFWGLKNDSLIKPTSACNTIVTQYAWQKADALSRDAIRQGIIAAESRLREYLGYSVGRVFVEETLEFPRPKHYGHQWLAPIDGDGRWLGIRTSEGFLRSIGKETYSVISASAEAVASDADGDGLNDTFTVTLSGVTVENLEEIGVYFLTADRLDGEPVSEKYRIAPVSMTLASGVLTIKGRLYLLVKPVKYEGFGALTGLDPATSGVLASHVAVHRRYASTAGTTTDDAAAVLIWETDPWPSWAYCDSGLTYADGNTDPAALAYAVARAQIRDARNGLVSVGAASYDATNAQWNAINWNTCRQPDRVLLRYEAGAKLDALENTHQLARIAGNWDQIVARFACAEMPRRQFGCQDATMEIYTWQFDLARSAGSNSEQYRISEGDLSNPFGTDRGAVYAWNRVKNLATVQAFLPG